MAAQGERVSRVYLCVVVLDPMAQDIPKQDIVMGELELPPQMDPKPEMAAACDTSPPLPPQNPSPIPAQTARPSAPDMAQLFAMLAGISGDIQGIKTDAEANTKGMREEIKNNAKQMKGEMKAMRGEMRQVGQCLQAGKWRRHVLRPTS